MKYTAFIVLIVLFGIGCKKESSSGNNTTPIDTAIHMENYPAVMATFGGKIDFTHLYDYASQTIPYYITKDNASGIQVSNKKVMLGRVLFYDKQLSIDNSVSCASCHKQEIAFSDTALASHGVMGGLTGRHSMRLINARFAEAPEFFWDKRAATLEDQTTRPMKDHNEMGFSGQSGRPDFDSLLRKIASMNYYQELFGFVYGDKNVTEIRLQECLAQFVRSIQSFDSKYDEGRAQVTSSTTNFPNFTNQENTGKMLFMSPPVFDSTGNRISGGLNCNSCHRAPEFDIDPKTGNNGIIGKLNATGFDLTNKRAPSLRDLAGINGEPNSPMMHTGVITTLQAAIGHYGAINANPGNTELDRRLKPNGQGQKLNLNAQEINSMIAFLKTLTGKNVYSDVRWSNTF